MTLLCDYVDAATLIHRLEETELKAVVQNAVYQVIVWLEDLGLEAGKLARLKRSCLTRLQVCSWIDNFAQAMVEILDAARIDGLSEPAIFIHMYMPIMKPSYAVAPIIMTGIVLATLPRGFLFFVMQKHFVAGMVGAVK